MAKSKTKGFTYDDFTYDDFTYEDFTYDDCDYDDYEESETVKNHYNNLNNHNLNKPGEYQSKYMGLADEILTNYMNRDPFSYDLNGDALYQQYKDKYITQGKMAMQDTTAQAAAMTGGYGNSYAATVGNQAYQASLQNLNDVVPQLYQMAYDRYNQEGQDMLNQYGLLTNRDSIDYSRYRDSVTDWNAERDYLTNLYNNERNFDYSVYSDNRNFDYGVYSDSRNFAYNQYSDDRNLAYNIWDSDRTLAYNTWDSGRTLAYNQYRDGIADEQWQKTFDEGVRQYNTTLAENKRQYNTTRSDNTKYSNYINPDDIEVDENGNITSVKGYTLAGDTGSTTYTPSISGFKTNKGDNFTVSVDGTSYTVENKGKVSDAATIKKLANATSYGDIKLLDGTAYYVKGNSYYKLGSVALWGKKDYGNLLSKLQG